MLSGALGKSSVVESDFAAPGLGAEIELHHRVRPFRPRGNAPSLNDSFVRNQLDLTTGQLAAKA